MCGVRFEDNSYVAFSTQEVQPGEQVRALAESYSTCFRNCISRVANQASRGVAQERLKYVHTCPPSGFHLVWAKKRHGAARVLRLLCPKQLVRRGRGIIGLSWLLDKAPRLPHYSTFA